jgi:hypothetical protein
MRGDGGNGCCAGSTNYWWVGLSIGDEDEEVDMCICICMEI